jgi:hypothetical protein
MICCFDTVDLRNGVPHLLRDAALEVFSWWSWKCLVIASLWSLAPFWFLSPWSASTAFGFLLLLYWVLFLPSGCRRALFRLASWAADPSWLDVVSLSTDSRSRSFNSNEWWFSSATSLVRNRVRETLRRLSLSFSVPPSFKASFTPRSSDSVKKCAD